MALLNVGTENSAPIQLYYEDLGSGQPVILIHGWPLNGRSWEKQISVLLESGYRVITYDRRGFGQSSQPSIGYDIKTLAADLNSLITTLDLRDVLLVGFSMGGTEVARYLGSYGSDRVQKAVFISAVTPCLLKSDNNLEGVEASKFEETRRKLAMDRPQFLTGFFKDFYNVGFFDSISEEVVHMSWIQGMMASPIGSLKCVDVWLQDYRDDLKSIKIPVLVIHGDADKTVPIRSSSSRMDQFLTDCEYRPIIGAPHGLNWTHADELNSLLLKFFGDSAEIETHKPIRITSAEQELGLH